jgi:tetratricopeptide (TPR) repeat protein
MKISSASSALSLVFLSLGLISAPARGARAQEGLVCLEVGDLACAISVRDAVLERGDTSDAAQILTLRTFFREGRYDEAVSVLNRLEAQSPEALARDKNPYRATALATRGMVEAREESVAVRHSKGVDRVLQEEALDVMGRSRRVYDALFGGGPDHTVLLDIFPTASRFIGASGLPPEAVRKTGVVALSKWSRLLISSPRALSRGYGWKDTIAHEYIHLVVAFRSEDRAPVWLQEGLAKLLESRWREDKNTALTVHQQSLLAAAVANDGLVPFKKFKHSMAYLDSGDEAALAFAQVATLVEHVLLRGQDAALPGIMERIRDGESPQLVMAQAGGYPDFKSLIAGWRSWLATKSLIADEVASLPVILDAEADDYAEDPLLAADMSRVRFARLGDLLLERDRPLAALIEYRKAVAEDGPPSPLMMAREATCLMALDRVDEALAISANGVRLYPEYTRLWITRGRILDALERPESAAIAWQNAHDLNPFALEVQRALIADFEALGRADDAARHASILRTLTTGGAATGAR